ncbi:MAG: NDP-sugar synthase [Candidatus Methanomethylophilaceae archaeon]|nr:NDP-sugar synthase [Candidatus Methanomethylophilaceae archaeon]
MEFRVRQAVVMVGGKGTRLLPLTETKPKPILPVADRPCIWYLVRSLARAGIEEVILACGYRPGEMEALGDGSDLGVRIVYSYEDEPLGTAGAMKLIEDRLDEVFVAANGDVFADIDVAEEIRVHMDTGAAVTIALTPVENPCEFGIARVDDTGAISEFREKPRPEEVFSNLINAGVYVMDRSVLGHVPEGVFFDFSRDLVPRVMADGGRIQGYNLDGVWMDVGRPHDLLGANLSTASREYADAEWPTVTGSITEGRIYVGEGSRVDGSSLRESAVLRGSTVTSSELDNVLVMRGCSIDGAVLSNTIVGDGCEIRRGARVTNAVLADNTVIGEDTVLDGGRVV